MRLFVAFLVGFFSVQSCFAWSEGGHHLIAEMAFDGLTKEQQNDVIELLRSHPRFAEDFTIPTKVDDPNRWLFGRAACWPDVARSQPKYHRPSWNWQPGAMILHDSFEVPADPGPLPLDATLETQDLCLAQAIELCRSILRDKTQPASDRAIAFCWLAHLVNNAHQPCHVCSLYCKQFPEGDNNGRSIRTLQYNNLYSLWEGLLGRNYDAEDIQRRMSRFPPGSTLRRVGQPQRPLPTKLEPMKWVSHSRKNAATNVYSPELLKLIESAQPGEQLLRIDLSPAYLEHAERNAESCAMAAARLLAEVLRQDLFGDLPN